MAAAKLTGISPRLPFYHMPQPTGDEGKSTKDFERDSAIMFELPVKKKGEGREA